MAASPPVAWVAGTRFAGGQGRPLRRPVALAAGVFPEGVLPGRDQDFLEALNDLTAGALRAMKEGDKEGASRAATDVREAMDVLQAEGELDEGTGTFLLSLLAMLEGEELPPLDEVDSEGASAPFVRALQQVAGAIEGSEWAMRNSPPAEEPKFETWDDVLREKAGRGAAKPGAGAGAAKGPDTDLYDALGVAPSASSSEIKKAFRSLALKYHPDVSSEEGAEERFREIAEAYEVLMDDDLRSIYDRQGSAGLTQRMEPSGAADIYWEEFKPVPKKKSGRQAARTNLESDDGPLEVVVGAVVEYPLRSHDVTDGRTHGVGLVVGRNAERGDAANLDPAKREICEVEPLWQPGDESLCPEGCWMADDLEGPLFPMEGELRVLSATFVRMKGVGKPEHWFLNDALSDSASSPERFEEQMV